MILGVMRGSSTPRYLVQSEKMKIIHFMSRLQWFDGLIYTFHKLNIIFVDNFPQDALEASSAGWSQFAGGGALGRSTSSAGERHSAHYQSPALPRRADTFAGFDADQHRGAWRDPTCSSYYKCESLWRWNFRVIISYTSEYHKGYNLCKYVI